MRRRILILLVTYTVLLPAAYVILGGCAAPSQSINQTAKSTLSKDDALNCVHAEVIALNYQITSSDGSLGVLSARRDGKIESGFGAQSVQDVITVNVLESGDGVTLSVAASRAPRASSLVLQMGERVLSEAEAPAADASAIRAKCGEGLPARR